VDSLFSEKMKEKDRDNEELVAALYQQIGQLKVELDWLKKKLHSSNKRSQVIG
jgi:putative transposase